MCYKGIPTTICSACDDNDGEILYFCDPRVGINCFRMHVEQEHLTRTTDPTRSEERRWVCGN